MQETEKKRRRLTCVVGSLLFICLITSVSALLYNNRSATAEETRQEETGQVDVIEGVMKLLNSDVPDDVVAAYIKQHGPVGKLTADQIVELKKAGASGKILLVLMAGGPAAGQSGEYPFNLDDTFSVAAPKTHELLTIYPILRKGPSEIGEYLTLDEASDKKVISIKEQEGGGSVPVVIVKNSGRLPIYISAGEIIIGGKQDRMVAFDVLIKPGREIKISVRCVEQGRWHGNNKSFASNKHMAGSAARNAVQFEGQGKVWSRVAEQNIAANVTSSSGTLQATLNNKQVQKRTEEYLKALLPSLSGRHVVGMVVAINGEVISMDMFSNTSMFSKIREKLLKSAVLDTIGVEKKDVAIPGKKSLLAFFNESINAEKKALKAYGDNRNDYSDSTSNYMNESADTEGNLLHRYLRKKE